MCRGRRSGKFNLQPTPDIGKVFDGPVFVFIPFMVVDEPKFSMKCHGRAGKFLFPDIPGTRVPLDDILRVRVGVVGRPFLGPARRVPLDQKDLSDHRNFSIIETVANVRVQFGIEFFGPGTRVDGFGFFRGRPLRN